VNSYNVIMVVFSTGMWVLAEKREKKIMIRGQEGVSFIM
jgi:hypothetical protein